MSDELEPAPFVVGVGRSGTTLLRLMLDAHPDLAIPPETHFLPELISRFEAGEPSQADLVTAVKTHPGWKDFGLSEAELSAAFSPTVASGASGASQTTISGEGGAAAALRGFYGAYGARHGKPRWGDKTPVYIEHIELIGGVLGDQARFVHLIRDGRDVAVSRRARAIKRGREATPAAKEAATWRDRIIAAREQAKAVPHYLEVRYEDLVADTEPTLRAICDFAELEFEPAMLDYHRTAAERISELGDLEGKSGKVRPGAERQAAHALTSEPPRVDRLDRWRTELDAASTAEFEEVAGELLSELGYPLMAR